MKIRITFDAIVPTDASDEEIAEWLDFELGANECLSLENPLSEHELEAEPFSVDWRKA